MRTKSCRFFSEQVAMMNQPNLPGVLAFLFSMYIAIDWLVSGIRILRIREHKYKRFSMRYFRNMTVHNRGECVVPEGIGKIAGSIVWTLTLLILLNNGFTHPFSDVIRFVYIPGTCAAFIAIPCDVWSQRRFKESIRRKDGKCTSSIL
jgi:hypothetical protein